MINNKKKFFKIAIDSPAAAGARTPCGPLAAPHSADPHRRGPERRRSADPDPPRGGAPGRAGGKAGRRQQGQGGRPQKVPKGRAKPGQRCVRRRLRGCDQGDLAES